jgi:hypothetical protein
MPRDLQEVEAVRILRKSTCEDGKVASLDEMESEMDRACSTYWERRCSYTFWWGNLREGTSWKTQA